VSIPLALRREGWKAVIARRYRRVSARLVRRHSDIVMSKDLADGAGASPGTQLQYCAFDGGDPAILDRIEAARHLDAEDSERLRTFARRGYSALFAEVDGRIAGFMWWVDDKLSGDRAHPHLARYGIRLGPREAYVFDFYLEPGCRGGGNANEFLARFDQHLRSLGFERLWGFVAGDNKPARWLYTLCGWRPQKTVSSVEIARCLLFAKNGVFVRDSRRRELPSHDYRRVA
jgi:GNAT superfamily N-acetyltransferase